MTPEDIRWVKAMAFGVAVCITLCLLVIEPTNSPGSDPALSDSLGVFVASLFWVTWYLLATQEKK